MKKKIEKKVPKKAPQVFKSEPIVTKKIIREVVVPEKKETGRKIERIGDNMKEWLIVLPTTVRANNTAILFNASNKTVLNLKVEIHFNGLHGEEIVSQVGSFFDAEDERLIGRATLLTEIHPSKKYRFSLPHRKSVHGGICTVHVSGKTLDGEEVSVAEQILLEF